MNSMPAAEPVAETPITSAADLVEALLRRPRRLVEQLQSGLSVPLAGRLAGAGLVLAGCYGLVVGSFAGGEQWWAAPLKVALGTGLAGAICLPSLYVFACLAGSTARLATIAGLLAGMLVLTDLLLLGFVPVAWLFSQSTHSVAAMGALHLVFWLVAVGFGGRFLCRAFAEFGIRGQGALRGWLLIFLLVSLQMTAALRPLVGRAPTLLPTEKKSFVHVWREAMNAP